MADWLVARIAPAAHERASKHVARVGFQSFYARTRRTLSRPQRTEVRDLYSGYMFVKSPTEWYSVLACSSAIYGIVAGADLEPLRSAALDSHVEKLMASADKDGFLRAEPHRSRFLRGDRVRVQTSLFVGEGKFIKMRRDGGAEVQLDSFATVVVDENWMTAA